MRANTLEDIVPGLREAREGERLTRALAFSEVTWTVCGQQCVVLTPRHRLEFQLVRNAFAAGGGIPSKADVFQFLWRLNPRFKKRVFPLSPSAFDRMRLLMAVRKMDMHDAIRGILGYLGAMLQDLPEGSAGGDSSNPPENYVHWLAGEMNFYLARYNGFTPTSFMDTPYLVLQQLYRAHRLAVEQHPQFINNSDRMVGRWQREQIKNRRVE